MDNRLTKFLNLMLSLSGVIFLWWLFANSGFISQDLFPTPWQVAMAAVELYEDGVLIKDLKVSLTRASIGFAIGSCLGILIGLSVTLCNNLQPQSIKDLPSQLRA